MYRKWLLVIVSLYLTPIVSDALFAYDRIATVKYADRYWENYNNYFSAYDSDCANFVSQCLLSGNIKFDKSSGYKPGGLLIRAIELEADLRGRYYTSYKEFDNNSSSPSGLQIGDAFFLMRDWVGYDKSAEHTMIITETSPDDKYNGHTGSRYHRLVNLISLADNLLYKESLRYLLLPNAPIIKYLILKQVQNSNEKIIHEYKYDDDPDYRPFDTNTSIQYYKHTYNGLTPTSLELKDNPNIAVSGKLKLKIIFDTSMNTNQVSVAFSNNSPFNQYIFSDVNWSQTLHSNDTWEGTYDIPAAIDGADDKYFGLNKIYVEGSGLDSDGKLDEYNPGADTQHTFLIGNLIVTAEDKYIVTSPGEDKITLTIKNVGYNDLNDVKVETSFDGSEPDVQVSFEDDTLDIPAGASSLFRIKVKVGCIVNEEENTETAQIKFVITQGASESFYIKGCGTQQDCEILKAELEIKEEHDKCHECKDDEIVLKECPKDDNNECTQECDPETGECTSPTAKELDPCLECKDKKIVPKQCPEDGPDGCPIYACNSEAGGKCEAHYATDCETDNADPTYIQPPNTTAPNRDETSFQFSPVSSPGQKDALNIDYDVLQASLVTILIYDNNDNLIRTLINKALKNAGRHTEIWDGRNDAGELVPDGIYRFVISGVNAHNALDTWEISDEIIIDNTPPAAEISFIKAHFPQSGHYTLVGMASDEHLDISYVEWLKDNIHEDIDYNHISVIDGELGVFDATALEDGAYTVRLTVKDRAGNATIAEIPLIIDRTFNDLNIHINSVTYTIDLGSEGYIPTSDDPDVWLDEELPTGSTPIDI